MAQHGKGVANVFSSERNGIKFPMHADTYRATMSTGEGELTLWLENKRSKQQWQNKFKNVTECGTAGLPAEAVVALLQVRSPPELSVLRLSNATSSFLAESIRADACERRSRGARQ